MEEDSYPPPIIEIDELLPWMCPICGTRRNPHCVLEKVYGLSEDAVKNLCNYVTSGNYNSLSHWLQNTNYSNLIPPKTKNGKKQDGEIRIVSEFLHEVAEHIDFLLLEKTKKINMSELLKKTREINEEESKQCG